MRTLGALLLLCAHCAGAAPAIPASIVRLPLPPEGSETRPLAVPTDAHDTLEIDFPWPVSDWAGRGFTPNADSYAGDFIIEASRGAKRIFVTPVSEGAHRVLHVVLALPEGERSATLEFLPAPAGMAWHKVILTEPRGAKLRGADAALSPARPQQRHPAGAAAQLLMLSTLRQLSGLSAEEARALAGANPSLEFTELEAAPRSFGDFTVTCRFALRDQASGVLGLCATLASASERRLVFDPGSWVLRVGQHVYPVQTADSPGELEPGASAFAFMVLSRDAGGGPSRLLGENAFLPSVHLVGTAVARPVRRYGIEEAPTP